MATAFTRDEYLDMVDQAIYEADELLMCAQDEGDPEDSDFSAILPVLEQISKELKKLHASIMQGTHKFGGEELSFMPLVRQWKDRIPF